MKDKDDAAKIAKRNRLVDSGYVGEGRRKGRPMPGSRASGWKRTFRYGWVRRDGEEEEQMNVVDERTIR